MPEIGDKVLLKFTEHKGKSGIVLNNIMSSNEKNDPEIKKITAFKKKIYFEKEDIVLSTEDDKTVIKISETDGITIESDREIEIKADGDMEAISVGEMTISGSQRSKLQGRGNNSRSRKRSIKCQRREDKLELK